MLQHRLATPVLTCSPNMPLEIPTPLIPPQFVAVCNTDSSKLGPRLDYLCRMDPPIVRRGDWLQTKNQRSNIVLKFYDRPYPQGREVFWKHQPDFFVGPVHEWFIREHFLTVRVPHPDQPGQLMYCNIWSCGPNRAGRYNPVPFCKIIPSEHWAGWYNEFTACKKYNL